MKKIKTILVLALILISWTNATAEKLYCTYCGTEINREIDYCSLCTGDVKDIISNNLDSFKTIDKKIIKKEKPVVFNKLTKIEKLKIDFLIEKAEKSFEEEKFQACENFSRAAIRISKNTKKAWYLLARVENEKEHYDMCKKYLVETLKIDPLHEDAVKLAKEVN